MIPEELKKMGHEIRTQDNQTTSDPIFIVQQKRRIYGLDHEYGDAFVHLNDDGYETEESDPDGLRIYYHDTWEMVQVFFTDKAAGEYIEKYHYNMKEPRIYVASGCRNEEWISIRNFLKGLSGD